MTDTCGRTKRDGSGDECGLPAGWGTDHPGEGACKHHGGASSGAPKGNKNAVVHGAYAESFMDGFLTEGEQRRVKEAADFLDDQATAKEHGQFVAAMAMEQFRRTGDDRFLRRYESICDKFGIAPADEVEMSGELDLTGAAFEIEFNKTDE